MYSLLLEYDFSIKDGCKAGATLSSPPLNSMLYDSCFASQLLALHKGDGSKRLVGESIQTDTGDTFMRILSSCIYLHVFVP